MPLINVDRKNTDSHYRYKMPSIEVKHEGGGQYQRTLITNINDIAKRLNTSSEVINRYLAVELGTKSGSHSNDSEERLFLCGNHSAISLQNTLDGYIKDYVQCKNCNIPEGIFKLDTKKKKKTLMVLCPSCGHSSDLTSKHKVSKYIINHFDFEDQNNNQSNEESSPNQSNSNENSFNLPGINQEQHNDSFNLPGMNSNTYESSFNLPMPSILDHIVKESGFNLPEPTQENNQSDNDNDQSDGSDDNNNDQSDDGDGDDQSNGGDDNDQSDGNYGDDDQSEDDDNQSEVDQEDFKKRLEQFKDCHINIKYISNDLGSDIELNIEVPKKEEFKYEELSEDEPEVESEPERFNPDHLIEIWHKKRNMNSMSTPLSSLRLNTFSSNMNMDMNFDTKNIVNELDDTDLEIMKEMVQRQIDVRKKYLKKSVLKIISFYKNKFRPKISTEHYHYLNKVGEILELETMIGAILAEVIFDENILIDQQILNYKDIFEPFLADSQSQENFLTQYLVLIDKYPNLISEISEIIELTHIYDLVEEYVISGWHSELNDIEDPKKLTIYYDIDIKLIEVVCDLTREYVYKMSNPYCIDLPDLDKLPDYYESELYSYSSGTDNNECERIGFENKSVQFINP